MEQRSGGPGTTFRRPWNNIPAALERNFVAVYGQNPPRFSHNAVTYEQNAVRYKHYAAPFAHKPPLFYLSHSGGLGTTTRAYAMIVISTFLLALLALLAPTCLCAGCKRCKKCKLFSVFNNHSTQKKTTNPFSTHNNRAHLLFLAPRPLPLTLHLLKQAELAKLELFNSTFSSSASHLEFRSLGV